MNFPQIFQRLLLLLIFTARYQRENKLGMVFFGFMTAAFYSGEILGAYRAEESTPEVYG